MRTFASFLLLSFVAAARSAEPVVVDLQDHATVPTAEVLLGQVAIVTHGDAATRERVERLDLAEFAAKERSLSIGRRTIEYRLRLAGFDVRDFVVIGAERVGVIAVRTPVSAEEVVAAVKAELIRLLPEPAGMTVELVQPLAVRLPEIALADGLKISARPHARVTGPGRHQMDVSLSANGQRLLSFGLLFEAKANDSLTLPSTRIGSGPGRIIPAAAITPIARTEVLVKARQRVTIVARSGALNITTVGEAQQEGRFGQTISVQNVDSKKNLTARVTGPGTVEIDLGDVQ